MTVDEATDVLKQAAAFCGGRSKSPPRNIVGMNAVIEMSAFVEAVRRLSMEISSAERRAAVKHKVSVNRIFELNEKINRMLGI